MPLAHGDLVDGEVPQLPQPGTLKAGLLQTGQHAAQKGQVVRAAFDRGVDAPNADAQPHGEPAPQDQGAHKGEETNFEDKPGH